jgi:23S rRNA (adenine2503-C2)-methyltransferase
VQTQQYLTKLNDQRISNMVVMGIGEPFDNYENLSTALKILNDQWGVALGSRHITISTCGIVPMIEKFGKDFNQINLAISLHAPNDELRNQLMPVNKSYNLNSLVTAIKKYLDITNRRISFEYILLENVNDKPKHAQQLVKLLKGVLCYVNIILYNNVTEHHFKPSRKIN